MNNIKKLALGLLVAAFAFGFSAFKSEKNIAAGDRYVQTGPDEWKRVDPLVYNEGACVDNSDKPCFYLQDMSDTEDHGSTLTSAQITLIGSSLQPSEKQGVYDGPIN